MAGKKSSLRKFLTRDGTSISYVKDPSFCDGQARNLLEPDALLKAPADYGSAYMPDDVTKQHARCMHYAAYRCEFARTAAHAARWKRAYYQLRDLIVLGNQKLVYRAAQKFGGLSYYADDVVGECYLILIHAVSAFNPWLGIRFSTYAVTCLMRGLTRLARKKATEQRIALPLSVESLAAAGASVQDLEREESGREIGWLLEYFREDHPLLSAREKHILSRRFHMSENSSAQTLQEIGHELGISKERVRQMQIIALGKLRQELLNDNRLLQSV